MAYNFFGGGNTQTSASQWGVGNDSFGIDAPAAPVDLSSMASWGTPNTALATPSATGGYGGFASSLGSNQQSGLFGIQGLGANLPTLQLGLGGLSSVANLYSGLKALGLARDQFDFQKGMTQKNYDNSVQSYNTALSDRAGARASVTGQSAADTQAYINANKLK